jgi:hypothetical protein
MKHEPNIADRRDPMPFAEEIAKARLDYSTGRGVDHVVVREWLMTWGEPNYKPFDVWLSEWDG